MRRELGDYPAPNEGELEFRVLRDEADVGGEWVSDADAHRVAVDGCDYRLADLPRQRELGAGHLLGIARRGVERRTAALEIRARTERLPRARQYHDPRVVIEVRSFGLTRFTVWLGPNMIDFNKPVLLKRSGQYNREELFKVGMVKPSLSVMLEDFLERGDNTRLFVAKIEQKP